MPKENETKKKVVKDEGFVTINGKPHKINQGSPNIETMNKSLELLTFNKDYEQILKTIQVLNEGKDGLLADGYDDNFIDKLNGFDKNIELQKGNLSTLFSKANDLFRDILTFYLGPDITEITNNLGFIDLLELVNKCNEQNKYIKANLNKA